MIDLSVRSKVRPGLIVVLKGVIRGQNVPAIIYHVHPMDIEMTDLVGSKRPWNGVMPVVDVVMVKGERDNATDGEIVIVEKICWDGDIRRNAENGIRKLPYGMVEVSPRYIVIGELTGV